MEHVVAGGPNKVDKLQASDGKFIASYTLGAANSDAVPQAFDGINIWLPDHSPTSTTVYQVRAADGSTSSCSLASAATYPDTAAFDEEYIWVSTNSGYVVKVDPNSCQVQCTTSNLGSRLYDLAYDGSDMWVTAVDSNTVVELNSSCAQMSSVTVGNGPIGIVFDGTYLWTANQTGQSISRILSRARHGQPRVKTYAIGYAAWWIAYDGANVWTTDYTAGKVSIMPTSSPSPNPPSYQTCGSASSTPLQLAFDSANMWIGCQGSNQLGKM